MELPQCNIVINPYSRIYTTSYLDSFDYLDYRNQLILSEAHVIVHCLRFWFSWFFESTSKSPWQQALLSPSHRSSTPITWCFLDRWAARIMNEPYSNRVVCVQRGCWEFMCHVFVCSKRRCPRLGTFFHLTYCNLQWKGAIQDWI